MAAPQQLCCRPAAVRGTHNSCDMLHLLLVLAAARGLPSVSMQYQASLMV